jgi:hypothetical protein
LGQVPRTARKRPTEMDRDREMLPILKAIVEDSNIQSKAALAGLLP